MRGSIAGVVVFAWATSAAASDHAIVLPFSAAHGGAPRAQLAAARDATRAAVERVGAVLPGTADEAAGEARIVDDAADTTNEYRAAGLAAHADWALGARVESHGWTYRLELEACQVSTGRVESLTREIDARQAAPQIVEMLALLLRPSGVGDAIPHWQQTAGREPVPREAPQQGPTAKVAPSAAPEPQPEPGPAPSERPFGVGLGVSVLGAVARVNGGGDGAFSGGVDLRASAELAAVPGFELFADGSAGLVGATSLAFDLGGRYDLRAGTNLWVAPELAIGAFFPLAADRSGRLLTRGDLAFVLPMSEAVRVELYPEGAFAAGGTGSLWFLGGGARAVARF
jgi:hypothetical protein